MSRRILFFTQSLFYGGEDTVMLELLRAWPEPEDRLTLALNRSHPGRGLYAGALEGRAGLAVLDEDTIEEEKARSAWPRLQRPWRFIAAVARLRRFIREQSPDAVLVSSGGWTPTALTWRFLCAARLAGVPRVVLAAHNYPLAAPGLKGLYRRLAGGLASRLCGRLLSVSSDCAGAISRFNLLGRPAAVVLNGAAPRPPGRSVEEKRRELGVPGRLVGAIGNIEGRKGFIHLARAMREVCAGVPEARLVIIGDTIDPECREELLRFIGEAGLAEQVRLMGFLPDAGRFAECFEVCAIPSVERESFGLLALEAMRCGRPVVAARVGGLPEVVVDGDTGLLVPPADPEALARAILALLRSPQRARELGENGRRRWSARFTAAEMARGYSGQCWPPGGANVYH